MKKLVRTRKVRYGGVLISALAFVVITGLLVAGMATVSMSYYARAKTEGDYANALPLAEAGVNYEFRKISTNVANADQKVGGAGVTYNLGNGAFTVYCTNSDGSTPWSPPSSLYVVSTGTVNGVSRTIKVSSKGYANPVMGNYALFGVSGGNVNGSAATVLGDVGTDGTISFAGSPTINGSINFNGVQPSIVGGGYTVHSYPNPVVWPTVDSLANSAFPGGLGYVATHNDNALATPPILGTSVTLHGNGSLTLRGKPGGANYYLTDLTCNGNSGVTFDNSLGPINIWVGPSGGAGIFDLGGGAAAVKQSTDPSKPVQVYVATAGGAALHGNSELDAGIYSYNGANSGPVSLGGTPDIYGSVIAGQFDLHGNPTLHYQPGYFTGLPSSGNGYYGFDTSWQETGALY